MNTFDLPEVIAERQRLGRSYLEFLRVPSMSVGVYFLPVCGLDPQKPHTENELYYVMKGSGSVQVDGEDCLVEPGKLVLVRAGAEHRFHSITEDLTLLVIFSPAESS